MRSGVPAAPPVLRPGDSAGTRGTRGDVAFAFTSLRPLRGREATWHRATRFVDEVLADPSSDVSPLLVGSAARLLAATALTVFPNTAVVEATSVDRHDAHPAAVRRAIAFIESAPEADLSVDDIARAAHVTPRALQLAFRRHLDTTPLQHLRRVRLELAHRQLQAALPGDGLSVTTVAARWGFTPSRFAEHYRAAYGVTPRQTLRG